MDVIQGFEDILELFARHSVRYLIVGGLAFIYHAKSRYTKDIGLWIGADHDNVVRANRALEEFGSPMLMTIDDPEEIVQLGVTPNHIDLPREMIALGFEEAWPRRIESRYGRAPANWIDLDSLLAIKSAIDHPRHQEDARILRAEWDRRGSE